MALGPGGVTRVAGWTRYSPQQISHILLGRKPNPIVMAYVAGMIGQPWTVAAALVEADVPAELRAWWDDHGREAFRAGKAGRTIDGPAEHAAFCAVVRSTAARFRLAHVTAEALPKQSRRRVARAPKTLHPPGAAGGPHRRVQGTSSGDTSAGNGARESCAEEPMRDVHIPQDCAAAQERIA